MISAPAPQLAAPGAGIPWVERTIGKFIIMNFKLAKTVDVPALRARYQASLAELVAAAKSFPEALREIQILIPRLRGLEDSSRYYSTAMVLEHIALVDTGISNVVGMLGQGEVPPRAPGTADVKPAPGTTWADASQKLAAASEKFISSLDANFNSNTTLPHPWFGPLTAWQWAQFAVVHHAIHREQLFKMYQVSQHG